MNKPVIDDSKLRELLKSELPESPRNPWFVRKVINRLPEKNANTYTWIEYLSYILTVIILAGCWVWLYRSIESTEVIGFTEIISMIALGITGFVIVFSFLSPWVRKWLVES